MLLLPAHIADPPPTPGGLQKFLGVYRLKVPGPTLYVAPNGVITTYLPLPEPEILPVEMPIQELFASIKCEALLEFQMTSAVLAMCQGLPFDSTLLKGIAAHVA